MALVHVPHAVIKPQTVPKYVARQRREGGMDKCKRQVQSLMRGGLERSAVVKDHSIRVFLIMLESIVCRLLHLYLRTGLLLLLLLL